MKKIIAFFMSIIALFMQFFGLAPASKVVALKDVQYGSLERQVVDIYLPESNEAPVGLLVYIHGGGWIQGDKSAYTDTCKSDSKNLGYITATVNYRYIDENTHWQDLVSDIASAVSKIKSVAEERGYTIKAAAFGGHSAGAHIAMMYSYTYADKSAVPVAFCFDCSGPTNMADDNFYLESNALGRDTVLTLASYLSGVTVTEKNRYTPEIQAALLAASPLAYISSSTVPTIIAHGDSDSVVPYSNAVSLDSALTAAGVTHDFISYKSSDHDLGNDKDAATRYSEVLHEYAATYLE